ncbi:MAG: tRNA lysidine(34) synthetase TilS [Sedimentisphaerales bacterium]
MLSEFEKKIADFIKAHVLFGPADRVLLAISGGADSIALLYVMRQLLTHKVLKVELLCAHINHQLRGREANLDEDFVTAEAAKLKLPLMTKRLDVRGFARGHKLSIETAARRLRIEALLDMARVNSCCCIATGHQKNDNAETILHRLTRGTGFRGLGGIWPMRTFNNRIKFVRPLLCVTRNEIIEYLQQRNLQWRADHTNADCTYRRNYIRHRLLPQLQQKCNNSIVEQLFGLSQSAQRFYGLVCSRAEDVWPKLIDSAGDKVVMNLGKFLLEPPAIKVELIRRSLTAIGSGERDLTQKHYEKILRLAEQNVSGKKIELPGRFTVQREYGNLIFARVSVAVSATAKHTEVKIPGAIKFGSYSIEATVLDAGCSAVRRPVEILDTRRKTKSKIQFMEYFDLDKVKLPLFVRFRQAGDKFWPLGLPAEKKVGKFLTAQKVPQQIRKKLLIVTDSEKTIWVWPIRISEQARITSRTRRILQLQITDANSAKAN